MYSQRVVLYMSSKEHSDSNSGPTIPTPGDSDSVPLEGKEMSSMQEVFTISGYDLCHRG